MCARARFSVEEVVDLTLAFYKRNYIEGLFLSSGIIQSADYTMEELIRVARTLREDASLPRLHPSEDDPRGERGADRRGGALGRPAFHQHRAADGSGLKRFAPEKQTTSIKRSMAVLRLSIDEAKRREAQAPRFAPAGQSTQMIVGADARDRRDDPVDTPPRSMPATA